MSQNKAEWTDYLKLMRFDHWIKNIFVFPGVLFAYALTQKTLSLQDISVGLFAVCFASSTNYVLNEWLDRDFDRFHPVKKNRPSVSLILNSTLVYLLYLSSMSFSVMLAWLVGLDFLVGVLVLLSMGLIYNVSPLRSKDRPFLDVLTESFNNPIRLFLGWVIVCPFTFPPSSLMISYWMAGAFLMGVKRFSELRFIKDRSSAGLYRRSFKFYNEENLLGSILFYAICSGLFGGVFLVRHRVELILLFPFYAALFSWYLMIGFKPNSATQNPEKLMREKPLLLFSALLLAATIAVIVLRIPGLERLILS